MVTKFDDFSFFTEIKHLFLARMTHNQTNTITTKMKMTKNFKKIYNRYYQCLCICRKNITISQMIYDI